MVLTVVPLVSALADPVIGYWSDRTSSRLGRRLPFILAATPLWALFALLLFTPPRAAGTRVIVGYFAVALACYSISSITSGGPYESLLPEIATTSTERVSVNGFKVYFGAAGGAVGLVGSGLIVDRFGFVAMAAVMASLALAFRYVGAAGIWRRASRSERPAQLPIRHALRATLANHYFRLYLSGFVLFQIGLNIARTDLPYFAKSVLRVAHTGTWVAALTAVLIATLVLAVPSTQSARAAARNGTRSAARCSAQRSRSRCSHPPA